MRRFATIALSLSLVLGLTTTHFVFAQDAEKKDASTPEEKKVEAPKEEAKATEEPKKEEAPKEEPKKDEAPKEAAKPAEEPKKEEAPKEEPKKEEVKKEEAPKEEPKKEEAKKEEPKKEEAPKEEPKKEEVKKEEVKKEEAPKEEPKKESSDAALAPIPPEVEAKLEAARRAVAEAIVAAQDAGLVQTTIDPPPILDILITGRATDEKTIKDRNGVSIEVFGAWWTDYGKPVEGITAARDIRIVQPSKGLKTFFDQRAAILNKHIKAVRDAKGGEKPKEEAAKPAEPKAEEPKKEEPKK